jgi:hypothetical protein
METLRGDDVEVEVLIGKKCSADGLEDFRPGRRREGFK